jgi:hypothetical protein
MEKYINDKRSGLRVSESLLIGTVLFLLLLLGVGRPVGLFAQDGGDVQQEEPKENVFNLYDQVVGAVDTKGNITNKFGRSIGSVNRDGSIFNISGIDIGKVTPEGEVLNQAGTVLGSVSEDGSVYNVSGRKVGQVKEVEEINLMGGAARLLFLK